MLGHIRLTKSAFGCYFIDGILPIAQFIDFLLSRPLQNRFFFFTDCFTISKFYNRKNLLQQLLGLQISSFHKTNSLSIINNNRATYKGYVKMLIYTSN